MTSAGTESVRMYELVLITYQSHSRRFTFELYLIGQQRGIPRMLSAVKQALEQQHLRRLGIQSINFPAHRDNRREVNRNTQRLIVETTTLARSGTDENTVRDQLYTLLDGIVPTIVEDVDQLLCAKDATSQEVDAPVVTVVRNRNGRRHDRKQKRRHVNALRRQRRAFKRNALAAQAAFQDADMAPVVLV